MVRRGDVEDQVAHGLAVRGLARERIGVNERSVTRTRLFLLPPRGRGFFAAEAEPRAPRRDRRGEPEGSIAASSAVAASFRASAAACTASCTARMRCASEISAAAAFAHSAERVSSPSESLLSLMSRRLVSARSSALRVSVSPASSSPAARMERR